MPWEQVDERDRHCSPSLAPIGLVGFALKEVSSFSDYEACVCCFYLSSLVLTFSRVVYFVSCFLAVDVVTVIILATTIYYLVRT